jgi:nucleoside-diphosphate-sugar epimerase
MPTYQANLTSALNVMLGSLEVAVERVVLTGSVEEPRERSAAPCSPYAAAKHAATAYGRMFSSLYGLPVTTLRIAMVYGPGQRDTTKLLPHVITSLLGGRSPQLSSGTREVDWVYVDDVVDAIVCAAVAADVGGRTFDVGSGDLVTVATVVAEIYKALRPGVSPPLGVLADRLMEQAHAADVETTFQGLGWTPRIDLHDGLNRTIEWYAKHL